MDEGVQVPWLTHYDMVLVIRKDFKLETDTHFLLQYHDRHFVSSASSGFTHTLTRCPSDWYILTERKLLRSLSLANMLFRNDSTGLHMWTGHVLAIEFGQRSPPRPSRHVKHPPSGLSQHAPLSTDPREPCPSHLLFTRL
jgi:hypothetical protein